MKVFIIGIGGFIGSHLAEAILAKEDWSVLGLDTHTEKLGPLVNHPRLTLARGDMATSQELLGKWIAAADIVVPLAAVPLPAIYVRQPIATYDLTFEQNLRVIRLCAQHSKRLLLLSSSESYGMCQDTEFCEDTSPLVLGPPHKSRWIYASCKQLLERMAFAYGEEQGLRFTIVRPFNWIGPRQDNLDSAIVPFPRVVVQFIRNLTLGDPLLLINGGNQKRCFMYVTDGIDLLMRVIESDGDVYNGQVFNAGAPFNEITIAGLAEALLNLYITRRPTQSQICTISGEEAHGSGYQDTLVRRPSIKKAKDMLGWAPRMGLHESLDATLDYYLNERA